MDGKPIGCPLRDRGIPQPCFIFGCGSRLVQALRERGNLSRKWAEKLQVGRILPGRDSSSAECAHPLGGPRNRSGDTPTHDEKRDYSDKKNIDQSAQKHVPPNSASFRRNVSGVMHDCEGADDGLVLIRAMQWHNVDVKVCGPQFLEDSDAMIVV